MKNQIIKIGVVIIVTLTNLLISSSIFAQSPQKMSYQAVIRNSSNVLVVSHAVGMRISILQGSATGTEVYSETQTPITNANGLVSIEIGNGAGFSSINWVNGPYFIKTETDPTGGTNYTITGTSQLLSVPYSLNAKTAETADYNNLTNLPTLNIANWDIAYSWGNHAAAGYLTSYTETDPVFSTHLSSHITGTDTANWNHKYNLPLLTSGSILFSNGFTIAQDNNNLYWDNTNKHFGIGTQTPSAPVEIKSSLANQTRSILKVVNSNEDSVLSITGNGASISIDSITGCFSVWQLSINGKKQLMMLKPTNTFIGYNAGISNSDGVNNVFIGNKSGYSNQSGDNNIFMGDSSGYTNTSGEQNIFLGNGSGKTNSFGNYNSFIGYQTGQSNTTANFNTFIGYQAGLSTKVGSKNIFIGYQAGYKNIGSVAGPSQAGNSNIYIGDQAGYNNSLGRSNVYIGHNAGLGSNPINTSSYPRFNVYIGYQAGYLEYQGRNNTFIGYRSGYSNYSGTYSTFIGDMAGYSNYTGSYNTFIGNQAGYSHYSGNSNVNIGNYAGWSNSTGDGNIFLGYYAGYWETGSNKLLIDNQDRLTESLSRTKALIYGEFNATTSNQQLTFNSKVTTNGTFNYGSDAGTTDDYLITIAGISNYVTGMIIYFRVNTANTGSCTININSLGAKSLKSLHDQDPADNYFEAGSMVQAIYDGTNFQILSPDANP